MMIVVFDTETTGLSPRNIALPAPLGRDLGLLSVITCHNL